MNLSLYSPEKAIKKKYTDINRCRLVFASNIVFDISILDIQKNIKIAIKIFIKILIVFIFIEIIRINDN